MAFIDHTLAKHNAVMVRVNFVILVAMRMSLHTGTRG